jgi:antitoxin component of MazEF toxin-antitoxin module
MTVVSLPNSLLADCDLSKGDRVVLEPTEDGFRAQAVEWEVRDS